MSYQNNYNNNNNHFPSVVYSTPSTQQELFTQVFNTNNTPVTSPAMMNDWFHSQDHLFKASTDAFQDLLQLLPISPPLTASPVSDHQENNDVVSAEALVALFPDILNQQSTPKPVQVRRLTPVAPKPAPVAIMPKTAIPIAPRPGVFTPTMNNMKRKIEHQQESDEVAQKRQKNTDAARRSRLKKIIKMETLEKQVTELEGDNSRLTTRVAVLESEKTALITKDKGLEDRIRVLEAQLAEAHRALTSKSQ